MKCKYLIQLASMGFAAFLLGPSPALAASAPNLGSAGDFAVLSAAPGGLGAVTCTDSTIIGDVGSSGDQASVTQTDCTISGAIIAPVSAKVLSDFNRAYDRYGAITCTGSLNTVYTDTTLTLLPGVYCNTAGVTFTRTTLTLDADGDPNAVWIFKIGTGGFGALTGTNFDVVMTGEGEPCNVTWWVAEAATITDSDENDSHFFVGTILAGAAITTTGTVTVAPAIPAPVTFTGDAFAKAAVTMSDTNLFGCEATGHGHGGKCNQGVGNGPEDCDPGNSNQGDDDRSNDEEGGEPGEPGRQGGNGK